MTRLGDSPTVRRLLVAIAIGGAVAAQDDAEPEDYRRKRQGVKTSWYIAKLLTQV